MAELDWKHHTLIQTLLTRGPLKEEEFNSLFTGVTGKNPGSNQQLFNEYLRKINKELAFVQFELRACRNQYDGNVYYGVVNNVADEQSKLGTKYSVPQIAYYKAVIEAIVEDVAAQGSISYIDALNIRLENKIQTGQGSQVDGQSHVPAAFKNFSMSQKEKTIDDLVRERWLSSFPNGKIGLGVRSFLDLRSWFRSNEIPSCDVCNEAGIKAELCSNEGCTARMHTYCLRKKFSQRRVARVCPSCGTEWPNSESIVEEEESKPDVPTENQEPIANPGPRKKLRSWKAEEADTVEIGLVMRKRLRSFKTQESAGPSQINLQTVEEIINNMTKITLEQFLTRCVRINKCINEYQQKTILRASPKILLEQHMVMDRSKIWSCRVIGNQRDGNCWTGPTLLAGSWVQLVRA